MSDQELIAKQEHVWDTITALCTPFTEREWKTPTDCPGWSVQDQLAHIVGTESWLLGQPVPDQIPKDMSHVKNELGQWIEPWVDRCRSWPGARVLEEFITVTRERRRILHAMSAEEFTREFQTPIGSHTMRGFLPIRVFANWVHEQDIRRAVGRPGHFTGPVAEHSLERVARAMSVVVGRKVRPAPGTTVVFEVTGPLGRTLPIGMAGEGRYAPSAHAVAGGRAVPLDQPPAVPTVRLTMDVETFVCLGCGRWAPEQALASGTVRIAGDRALAERIIAQMNFMP
jgi:uncharacterized protein (TIGR03083 family)